MGEWIGAHEAYFRFWLSALSLEVVARCVEIVLLWLIYKAVRKHGLR